MNRIQRSGTRISHHHMATDLRDRRAGLDSADDQSFAEACSEYFETYRLGLINKIPPFMTRAIGQRSYSPVRIDSLRVAYYAIPKCASTSIKTALHELEHGIPLGSDDIDNIHGVYRLDAAEMEPLRYADYYKFAVVRDPVERFVSAFRNRILHFRDHLSETDSQRQREFEDINFSARNIRELVSLSQATEHHFTPQTPWFGSDTAHLDDLFAIDQIPEAIAKLRYRAGADATVRRLQTVGPAMSIAMLSRDSLDSLFAYYAEDYRLLSQHFSIAATLDRWTEQIAAEVDAPATS